MSEFAELEQNLERRQFLQRLGLAGAGLAGAGLLAACGKGSTSSTTTSAAGQTATTKGKPLSVGVLLPLSGVYQSLGFEMRDGFQAYLDEHGGLLGGRPTTAIVEETEGNPTVAKRKADKLLQQDKVPVVVGIVLSNEALALRDTFHEEQVPLIVANAGANDITRKSKSPYIFRTSFSNWQPNYPLGTWAYDNVSKDGIFLTAPDYAAGHEMANAFKEAYEKAGGKIAGEVYPPFQTTTDYSPFLSQIKSAGSKATFAFFSGGEAISFVKQYKDFGLKETVPLIGPGFLTDDTVLVSQADAALGIRTSLFWSAQLDNAENKAFVAAYKKKTNKGPTNFAMQMWDTARLLDEALKINGDTDDKKAFSTALEQAGTKGFPSPRGTFKLDQTTHNVVQNMYILEVRKGTDGTLGNYVVKELGAVADPG